MISLCHIDNITSGMKLTLLSGRLFHCMANNNTCTMPLYIGNDLQNEQHSS